MDITFPCSKCGQRLVVDESGAGVQVQCPKCGQSLTVSTPSRPAAQSVTPRVQPAPIIVSRDPPDILNPRTSSAQDSQATPRTRVGSQGSPPALRRLACPECGKDDVIQKVSAVYAAGISRGAPSVAAVGLGAELGSNNPTLAVGVLS